MVAGNFTGGTNCSLHVTARVEKRTTIPVSLNGTWDLLGQEFFGFYFRGTTNTTGSYLLRIFLASDQAYNAYYSYNYTDQGLWDGSIHGIVLNLSAFQTTGAPNLSSISLIEFEIDTAEGGMFDYSLQYLVTAHNG